MASPATKGHRTLRVLIVDDSALLRGYLMDILRELETIRVVGQAIDATQAVELVAKRRPDVVILDIQLPGVSGIDVLHAVKAHHPAPVVIMFTNYPYPQYRQKCMELGADFFFDKSLEFDALRDVLTSLVRYFQHASQTDNPTGDEDDDEFSDRSD